jgi:hypothetical protein
MKVRIQGQRTKTWCLAQGEASIGLTLPHDCVRQPPDQIGIQNNNIKSGRGEEGSGGWEVGARGQQLRSEPEEGQTVGVPAQPPPAAMSPPDNFHLRVSGRLDQSSVGSEAVSYVGPNKRIPPNLQPYHSTLAGLFFYRSAPGLDIEPQYPARIS